MSYGGIARGARGERLATEWYRKNVYSVLARNWRCDIGELDLVVVRGTALVFAEVKARASDRFGLPAEAVGPVKQRKLRQLGAVFLRGCDRRFEHVRFDVVSIIGSDVQVIEAAF